MTENLPQEQQPGPITQDKDYQDVVEAKSGEVAAARTEVMELVWKCSRCGQLMPRLVEPPERCPNCGAPKELIMAVTED